MDNGYIIDIPTYNSNTYLYDVTIMIGEDIKKVVSCYRILNNTGLEYAEEPGYFYISMDSKYIYFKNTAIITDILKNIEFIKDNPTKTNQDLLEINIDPVQKYTYIVLSELPKDICINLALEDNMEDRLNQINKGGKYNSYDCLVKNMSKNNNTNGDKEETFYERLSNAFVNQNHNTPNDSGNDSGNNSVTIVDIHTYNKFYVYGLTTLNMLLIIIIIIMLLVITNEPSVKHRRR